MPQICRIGLPAGSGGLGWAGLGLGLAWAELGAGLGSARLGWAGLG